MKKVLPDFSLEKRLWKCGLKFIAGADEVGRGSFAGPVVAACVVMPNIGVDVLIDDSKRMTQRQRDEAYKWIKRYCIAFGIGKISANRINKLGIKKASEMAFRQAIKSINKVKIDHLLSDAFYIPYTKGLSLKNQTAIIKGDQKSISIAAASIVAKVYRDRLMTRLSATKPFTHYLWHKNKGYGTHEHRMAIRKHGITKHHRKQFVEKTLLNQS